MFEVDEAYQNHRMGDIKCGEGIERNPSCYIIIRDYTMAMDL
jgi:hypothetical protein